MANGGWYGTAEEWARLEAPLLGIDPVIDQFAREFGLPVTKNHKDWPDRSITWGSDVRLLIQIWLTNEASLGFDMWVSASKDRGDKRLWKHATLIKGKPVQEFAAQLPELLRSGRDQLVSWSKNMDGAEIVPLRRLP